MKYQRKQYCLDRERRFDLGLEIADITAREFGPLSQPIIAALCGVTPQCIQQIEYRAIKKLRKRFAEAETFEGFLTAKNAENAEREPKPSSSLRSLCSLRFNSQ